MKYYVSATGSDLADGLSQDTPWKTINKVNSIAFKPGDIVVFKRGDTFYGTLSIAGVRLPSQRKVTVGAYGIGPLPKLSRYKILNAGSWVNHTANIWKIDITDLAAFTGDQDISWQGVNVGFLRVDKIIKPAKKWSIAALASDWDFYSDEVQYLYVWSVTNPGTRATEICSAVGHRIVNTTLDVTGQVVRYTNIDFVGCAGHGISGVLKTVSVKGCYLHELGGGKLFGYGDGTTRYGNGVECWNGSTSVEVEGNYIWDVYDVACTMQGSLVTADTGWTDVWFRHNVISRCTQNFEVWSRLDGGPATAGVGFNRTGFVNNICLDAGYSWAADVRPAQFNRSHLLLYSMEAPASDIVIRGNTFYNAYGTLIARSDGVNTLPIGYNIDNNYVFLRAGQPIFTGADYTAEQFSAFATAYGTGANCTVSLMGDSVPSTVGAAFNKLITASVASAAEVNLIGNSLASLHGDHASLKGEVENLAELQIAARGLCDTTYSTVAGVDGFGKLMTIKLRASSARFDGTLIYSLGTDSDPNRNSVGILSVQIVPSAPMTEGTTYCDLDVFQIIPFQSVGIRALFPSDFSVVVTEETGSLVTVEIYFNIGKDDYSRLQARVLTSFPSLPNKTEVTLHSEIPLLAALPAGTVTVGTSTDVPYQAKPLVGTSAPAITPSVIGQKYCDTVAKKEYTAFGIASSSDWVLVN